MAGRCGVKYDGDVCLLGTFYWGAGIGCVWWNVGLVDALDDFTQRVLITLRTAIRGLR